MSEKIEIEKFLGLAKPVIQLERGQLVALILKMPLLQYEICKLKHRLLVTLK